MRFSDLDLSKTYTYADYLKWQFEERLELIKGRIFKISPAPRLIHQKASAIIFYNLFDHLKDKQCDVYALLSMFAFPVNQKKIKKSSLFYSLTFV